MRKGLLLSTLLAAGFSLAGATGALAGVAVGPGACFGNACVTTPADPLAVRFDENGNASISVNGGAFTPLVGTLGLDPSVPAGGGTLPVLIYNLPQQVISGDVRIFEPTATNAVLSDALRFTTGSGDGKGVISGAATGAGRTVMIYYSDFVPGDPDDNALAHVGIPHKLGHRTL